MASNDGWEPIDDGWEPVNPFDSAIAETSGIMDDRLSMQPRPKRSVIGTGIDSAIDFFGKGVVDIGESAVGLADVFTGNYAGELLSKIGYDPKATKEILESGYSEARKYANNEVQRATGFFETLGALVDNPSVAFGTILESAPMALGSAGVARAVAVKMLAKAGITAGTAEATAFFAKPATQTALIATSRATEGAMTTGSIQEQGRQEGRSWSQTVLPAIGAGVVTAGIGFATSKIPGFKDADVLAATSGLAGSSGRSVLSSGKEIAKSTFKEGFEELTQSAEEQVFTNLALGKPWDEGVGPAAAHGLVAGVGQGGSMATVSEAYGMRPDKESYDVTGGADFTTQSAEAAAAAAFVPQERQDRIARQNEIAAQDTEAETRKAAIQARLDAMRTPRTDPTAVPVYAVDEQPVPIEAIPAELNNVISGFSTEVAETAVTDTEGVTGFDRAAHNELLASLSIPDEVPAPPVDQIDTPPGLPPVEAVDSPAVLASPLEQQGTNLSPLAAEIQRIRNGRGTSTMPANSGIMPTEGGDASWQRRKAEERNVEIGLVAPDSQAAAPEAALPARTAQVEPVAPEISPTTKVLSEYTSPDVGLTARVAKIDNGFSVTHQDIESGKVLPEYKIFKTVDEADRFARSSIKYQVPALPAAPGSGNPAVSQYGTSVPNTATPITGTYYRGDTGTAGHHNDGAIWYSPDKEYAAQYGNTTEHQLSPKKTYRLDTPESYSIFTDDKKQQQELAEMGISHLTPESISELRKQEYDSVLVTKEAGVPRDYKNGDSLVMLPTVAPEGQTGGVGSSVGSGNRTGLETGISEAATTTATPEVTPTRTDLIIKSDGTPFKTESGDGFAIQPATAPSTQTASAPAGGTQPDTIITKADGTAFKTASMVSLQLKNKGLEAEYDVHEIGPQQFIAKRKGEENDLLNRGSGISNDNSVDNEVLRRGINGNDNRDSNTLLGRSGVDSAVDNVLRVPDSSDATDDPEVTYHHIQHNGKGWESDVIKAPASVALKHIDSRLDVLKALLDCVNLKH